MLISFLFFQASLARIILPTPQDWPRPQPKPSKPQLNNNPTCCIDYGVEPRQYFWDDDADGMACRRQPNTMGAPTHFCRNPLSPSTPKPKPSQPSTGGFPGRFEKCPPPVRVRVTSRPPIPSDFRCSPDARWQYHCRGRVVVVDGEVTISDNRPSVSFICRVSFDSVHCPVSGEHPKSDSVELRESSGGNWPMCKK